MSTSSLEPYYDARDALVEGLARELVGPGRDDEPTDGELVLTDPPITRYLSGVLFPQSAEHVDSEEDLDLSADSRDETGATDSPVAMANLRYPSSFGMTFAVDIDATSEIEVGVWAATYRIEAPELGEEEGGDGEETADADAVASEPGSRRRSKYAGVEWRREPLDVPPVTIELGRPVVDERAAICDGLELFWRVRPPDGNVVSVTLGLINTFEAGDGSGSRDADSFFQPEIEVTGGKGPCFVARGGFEGVTDDRDIRSYRLLYRHARQFATGHGCSVTWEESTTSPGFAEVIKSTFVPTYELLLADSDPGITSEWFSMRRLSDGAREEVVLGLRDFCDLYKEWISSLRTQAVELDDSFAPTAAEHIDFCESILTRMRSGIDLLDEDESAWRAFQLANRAMFDQRARTVWVKAGAEGESPSDEDIHEWRPFQLAFILLALRGLTEPDSEDRQMVDLLWFPTGGGKTEAYLGLIAYCLFLRRLRNRDTGAGVTVLMRYTLRLLTIQQFERASSLICACEALRRQEPEELGSAEFSIGLWVGKDSTPNTRKAARQALNKLRANSPVPKGNPIQLRRCPWCGTWLDHRNYWVTDPHPRLVVACRNSSCEFENRLPVLLVDEDIYENRPSLIIATADKFASLPWRETTASLFNLDSDDGPPELIIQDELHLISGPLGTLAGLYESAIDMLCENDAGVGPKVIASTATIRRAESQVSGLFNRPVSQFPPPGLDARDSWFAVERPRATNGSRRYIGLMAPGASQTTLMVRTYGSLLEGIYEQDAADEHKDPYWTLLGYFNSLRLLGGARMQVSDDIPSYMQLIASRSGRKERRIDEPIELTSREASSNIPAHLKAMERTLQDGSPLDVVLATNMISVGMDIDRLGLMVVMGQPQSASEYIQATSRVGRRYPGVVAVVFNTARSRDRSHYESFRAFHSALYRQVDASSVTPFSPRARDRGLHAVLVALCRLLIPRLRSNNGASRIGEFESEVRLIRDRLVERVRAVAPDEVDESARHLDGIISEWIGRADRDSDLVFSSQDHPDLSLLVGAGEAEDGYEAYPTLWSLRDVDTESNLYSIRNYRN